MINKILLYLFFIAAIPTVVFHLYIYEIFRNYYLPVCIFNSHEKNVCMCVHLK